MVLYEQLSARKTKIAKVFAIINIADENLLKLNFMV